MSRMFTEQDIRDAVASFTPEELETMLAAMQTSVMLRTERVRKVLAGEALDGQRPPSYFSSLLRYNPETMAHDVLIVCDRCSREWGLEAVRSQVQGGDRMFNIMVNHRTECTHPEMLNEAAK